MNSGIHGDFVSMKSLLKAVGIGRVGTSAHALGGVSGVASFIGTNEQLQ